MVRIISFVVGDGSSECLGFEMQRRVQWVMCVCLDVIFHFYIFTFFFFFGYISH